MQKINIEKIFNESFARWKSVMRYNVIFSLLYFAILSTLIYGAANYAGVLGKLGELQQATNLEIYIKRVNELMLTKEMMSFSLYSTIAMGLIFPLHIGFFNIFSKIDKKEEFVFSDLLVGFDGVNFIRFATYYIFWYMIYGFMKSLIIPAPFWVMLTLFVSPLMYFKNEPLGTAIISSFSVMRRNFMLILVCVLLSTVVVYSGILLFFVGYIFTFPFWNAMIYTLYQHIFIEETK